MSASTHYQVAPTPIWSGFVKRDDIDFIQVQLFPRRTRGDRRLLRAAADSRVAVIVNRPFVTGEMFRQVKASPCRLAKEIGCTSWAQFFLKWILAHPAVTCAIPATRNRRTSPTISVRLRRSPTRPRVGDVGLLQLAVAEGDVMAGATGRT